MQASDHTSWFDCFKCAYSFIDVRRPTIRHACEPLAKSGPPQFRNCSEPHFGFIEHGLYAAQIAWWLRFFGPERFMIVSASQLRDPDQQIKVRTTFKFLLFVLFKPSRCCLLSPGAFRDSNQAIFGYGWVRFPRTTHQ